MRQNSNYGTQNTRNHSHLLTTRTTRNCPRNFWKIKDHGDNPIIKWSVLNYCKPYSQSSNRCNLCLKEKTELALFSGDNLLNNKTELLSKCRHQNKYNLYSYDSKDWRHCIGMSYIYIFILFKKSYDINKNWDIYPSFLRMHVKAAVEPHYFFLAIFNTLLGIYLVFFDCFE